jgi:hypothetical protein
MTLVPQLAAELDPGTRAFSYGVIGSPAFVRCATVRRRGIESWGPWVSRQVLAPYTNVLDRIETAATADLTGLGPRVPEPTVADLHPDAVGQLLPRLREAGVARVFSLDPLRHPGLQPRQAVPLGLEDLAVHVYDVVDPLPREYLSCPEAEDAAAPTRPCVGSVRRSATGTDDVSYHVTAPQPVLLVMRATFARGWRATLDGAPATVSRFGASHRAVAVPAGEHQVRLSYRPPGLRTGLAVFAVASLVVLLLLVRPRR